MRGNVNTDAPCRSSEPLVVSELWILSVGDETCFGNGISWSIITSESRSSGPAFEHEFTHGLGFDIQDPCIIGQRASIATTK